MKEGDAKFDVVRVVKDIDEKRNAIKADGT